MSMLLTEGTVAQTITETVTSLMGVATSVLDTITTNPALSIFFFAGVIGIAISVVKRLK